MCGNSAGRQPSGEDGTANTALEAGGQVSIAWMATAWILRGLSDPLVEQRVPSQVY